MACVKKSLAVLLGACLLAVAALRRPDPTPAEIFEKRIRPIFQSPDPSSCTQCHLAGVDLKNYILPSHEKTFLSLRDQGLVNLDKPEESKILRLIDMGAKPGSELISEKVRRQEYEAFAEWIRASAKDPALRAVPKLAASERARPARSDEVIRHARNDRVLASFVEKVWSQRQRCLYCHAAEGGGNAKAVEEHGDEVTWMKATPEATLAALLTSRIVNSKAPDRSLLLTKPTQQVKHGGGQKMLVGDMAYKAFRDFIEDYVRTRGDGYAKASELPKAPVGPLTFGTTIRLKIAGTPPAWAGRMLQVKVHAWDAAGKRWEAEPVAVSDRAVWGEGKLWAHELWLTAARDSARAKAWLAGRPSLPRGRYLLRVSLDLKGKLERDWRAVLDASDVIGETEIETDWPAGVETVIEAGKLNGPR